MSDKFNTSESVDCFHHVVALRSFNLIKLHELPPESVFVQRVELEKKEGSTFSLAEAIAHNPKLSKALYLQIYLVQELHATGEERFVAYFFVAKSDPVWQL